MKSFAVIAVLAVTVAAQSAADLAGKLPECALPCIQSSGAAAGCKAGDYACECKNHDDISAAATKCLLALGPEERCSTADLATTIEMTDQICEAIAKGGDDEDSSEKPTTTGDKEAPKETGDAKETGDKESGGDEEKPTGAKESDDDTKEKPTKTGSGDDAEKTGSDDDAEDDDDPKDESSAVKLGAFAWAGAAVAIFAF